MTIRVGARARHDHIWGAGVKYEEPEIRDYGDLVELTRASGAFGSEDGAGKTVYVVVDPIAEATVQLLP